MQSDAFDLNRRDLFVAGAAGLAISALPAPVRAAETGAAEQANVKLVTDFLKAWDDNPVDPNKLGGFMAEDCIVKLTVGEPPVSGRKAAIDLFKSYLAKGERYEIKVQNTFAKGPVVVTQRTDAQRGGGPAPALVGIFYIKGGKIQEWTDYPQS